MHLVVRSNYVNGLPVYGIPLCFLNMAVNGPLGIYPLFPLISSLRLRQAL
jgi:hypothetical protein